MYKLLNIVNINFINIVNLVKIAGNCLDKKENIFLKGMQDVYIIDIFAVIEYLEKVIEYKPKVRFDNVPQEFVSWNLSYYKDV